MDTQTERRKIEPIIIQDSYYREQNRLRFQYVWEKIKDGITPEERKQLRKHARQYAHKTNLYFVHEEYYDRKILAGEKVSKRKKHRAGVAWGKTGNEVNEFLISLIEKHDGSAEEYKKLYAWL